MSKKPYSISKNIERSKKIHPGELSEFYRGNHPERVTLKILPPTSNFKILPKADRVF
jgi:hypothetical protein